MLSKEEAHNKKVAAWVANAQAINPIITKAAQDGCLSQGTLEALVSAAGISLTCTTAPVILILPYPPIRNVKYHVPEKPPRIKCRRHREGHARRQQAYRHRRQRIPVLLHLDPGTPAYGFNWRAERADLTYGQSLRSVTILRYP